MLSNGDLSVGANKKKKERRAFVETVWRGTKNQGPKSQLLGESAIKSITER